MRVAKLPSRPPDGHKGTFGRVGVIGGQINDESVMLGGAVFAAKAAIRSGAGAVEFIAQKEVLVELIKIFPQATGAAIDHIAKCSSIIIGPGLGISHLNKTLLRRALLTKLPCVIDADGLNILSNNPELLSLIHNNCVLTPHPKEYERLIKAAKVGTSQELVRGLNCTVVLKSSETRVMYGREKWVSNIKNPALATGGTGDVLAGIIGGLLAQYYRGFTPFDCAKWGVQVHAKAGLYWSKSRGSGGLFIEELIDIIPTAMEKLRG